MPRPRTRGPEPTVQTRYPLAQVKAEIESLDAEPRDGGLGWGWRKQAAPALGMTESEFSKHINASVVGQFQNGSPWRSLRPRASS